MVTSPKNKAEEAVDKVAGTGSANRIEGKSKELLGRVLEELGEWLEQPEKADSAKEAAADTARRLKEIF